MNKKKSLYVFLGLIALLIATPIATAKEELKWGGDASNYQIRLLEGNPSHLVAPYSLYEVCNRDAEPFTYKSQNDLKVFIIPGLKSEAFKGYDVYIREIKTLNKTERTYGPSNCTVTAKEYANGTGYMDQTCYPNYQDQNVEYETEEWKIAGVNSLDGLKQNECRILKVQGVKEAKLGRTSVDNILQWKGIQSIGAEWFNSSCDYRQGFRIRTSGVSSTVANFTANFSINTSQLIAAGKMQSTCSGFWVANDNVTKRNWYPEDCNINYQNTTYWVNTPLTTTNDTDVWFYYGASCGEAPSASNTFSDYDVVMFLNETYNTSRLNIISGAASTSAASGVTNGTFGNGSNYNATTATYDRWASSAAFLPAPNAFWSAYFKAGNAAGSGRVLTKTQQGSARHRYTILIDSNTVFCGIARDAGQSCAAVTAAIITDNSVFHHAACSFTSANRVEAWVDGVYRTGASCAHAFNDATPEAFCLGQFGDACNAESYNGKIDDVRITDTLPTNQTIQSMYYKNIYYSGGNEEANLVLSFVSPTPANGTYVNQSYIFVNTTLSPGAAGTETCTITVYNSTVSGQQFSMTASGSGTRVCSFNLTSGTGTQTFQVNSSTGQTSGWRYAVLPVMQVRGFDESTLAALGINVTVTNTSSTITRSDSNTSHWFHNETPTGNGTITGSASGYQSRTRNYTYSPTANTTLGVIDLYLTSTSTGQNILFVIQSNLGGAVQGATVIVERQVGAVFVFVASTTSDGAGQAPFTLTSGETYRVTVTASGFSTVSQTVTINPVQSIYTIIMTSDTPAVEFPSGDFTNVSYFFLPVSSRISVNGTSIIFNVTATPGANLSFTCLYVYNATGTLLFYQNSSNTTNAQFNYSLDNIQNTLNVTAIGCIQKIGPVVNLNVSTFWYLSNFTNTTSSLYEAIVTIRNAGTDTVTFSLIWILISAIVAAYVMRLSGNLESGGFIAIVMMAIGTFGFGWFGAEMFYLTASIGAAIMFLKWRGVF